MNMRNLCINSEVPLNGTAVANLLAASIRDIDRITSLDIKYGKSPSNKQRVEVAATVVLGDEK